VVCAPLTHLLLVRRLLLLVLLLLLGLVPGQGRREDHEMGRQHITHEDPRDTITGGVAITVKSPYTHLRSVYAPVARDGHGDEDGGGGGEEEPHDGQDVGQLARIVGPPAAVLELRACARVEETGKSEGAHVCVPVRHQPQKHNHHKQARTSAIISPSTTPSTRSASSIVQDGGPLLALRACGGSLMPASGGGKA
jgi:hypothetical protein